MAGLGLALGVGVAFIMLGEAIGGVKQGITNPGSTSTKAINVEVGVGSSFNETMDKRFEGPLPRMTFYEFNGHKIGSTKVCPDVYECGLVDDGPRLDKKRRTAFRFVKTNNHPEYMKVHVSADEDDALCLSYMMINDAVDGHATSLSYIWNGSIGKYCGLPWYESDTFLPSTSQDVHPPCVWFSGRAGDGFPQGMSFRLRDMSNRETSKAIGQMDQYIAWPDTICKAPARMQFWKETDEKACIPYYKGFPRKTDNGTDANPSEVQFGHTLDKGCNPGKPFNNERILFQPDPVLGADGFGGSAGFVLDTDVDPLAKINKVATGGRFVFVPEDQGTATTPAETECTQSTGCDQFFDPDSVPLPDAGGAPPAASGAAPPVSGAAPPVSGAAPPVSGAAPPASGVAPPANTTSSANAAPPRPTPKGGVGVKVVPVPPPKSRVGKPAPPPGQPVALCIDCPL
jgi:hypothetical protein